MSTLLTGIAAWAHTPILECYIGGRRVSGLRASVELGYNNVSSAATILLSSVPSWVQFRNKLEVRMGYAGYNPQVITVFTGFVEDDLRETFPLDNEIKGAGPLRLTQYQYPTQVTYANTTDTDIVKDLLSKAGIHNYDVDGDGTVLGTLEDVKLEAGTETWDLINKLDQLFGYKTFDMPDGVVKRRRVTGIPAASAAFSYVKGINILHISRPRTVRGIHNKIIVKGRANSSGTTPEATRVADNPLVPNPPRYIPYKFENDLIETDAVASAIALRLIGEQNRVVEEITLDVPGNPYLVPEMTINLTHDEIGLSTATPFCIKHVTHKFEEAFVSTLVVEGGIGETGWDLGKPPLALFTYIISKEKYDIGGVPTVMYTVACDGSVSIDLDGPPGGLTYAWANNKNADTGTDVFYATKFTEAQMASDTCSITLTVTDPDGNTDALTQIFFPDAEDIITRDLYVAVYGRAEATPDGGSTWNTWTPGSGNVISTPEIAAEDHSYFGLDNGKLYYTDDYLVTVPTLINDFGSAINSIWITETDANRVTVGLQNGEIWRTENASLITSCTWTLLKTYGAAVLKAKENPLAAGQYYVCTGEDIRLTVDDFASDVQWNTWAGGTTRDVVTSFFDKYGSATHTNPVKREDGTEITFPVLVPVVSDVRAMTHHLNEDKLMVADDQGRTFLKAIGAIIFTQKTSIGGGVPNHMIRDGGNPLEIYAACDQGLYKTFDLMLTWVRMRDYTGAGINGMQVGYGSAQWIRITAATIVSNITDSLVKNLWNGASFDDPPANWRDATFDDSGWPAGVAASATIITPPVGCTPVWYQAAATAADERALARHSFTLDPGFITSAILNVNVDDTMTGLWINNIFLWQRPAGGPYTEEVITLDPAILLPGEVNVLAAHCQSLGSGGSATGFLAKTTGSANGSTVNVAKPAGVAEGDMMLACFRINQGRQVALAGWTQLRYDNAADGSNSQSILYKVAGASEPASYTFSLTSGSGAINALIVAYRSTDTIAINIHGGQVNGVNTNITAPSVTTTVDGVTLIGFHGNGSFSAPSSAQINPPTGMAENSDTTAQELTLESSDVVLGAAGATGTKVATSSQSLKNIGQLVALSGIVLSESWFGFKLEVT